MATTEVRLLKQWTAPGGPSHPAGAQVTVDAAVAQELITSGIAAGVTAHRPDPDHGPTAH